MKRQPRSLAPRDQAPSAFASALMRLCDALDALGAALVDEEGETVDYAATIDPYDMKIAAAEMSVLVSTVRASSVPGWAGAEELLVRGARRSLYVRSLELGYALVLLLPPRCFVVSPRAVGEAVRDLSREAGLPMSGTPRDDEQWCRVDVRATPDGARRPAAIWLDGGWRPLDVLGRYRQGLSRGETGYRARLASGVELNLVREPLGRWYADVLHFGNHEPG